MNVSPPGIDRTARGRVNAWLDAVPRRDFFRRGRARPAWRAAGIVGFHVAVVVLLAAGLATGRALGTLAVLAVACAASFFAWAWLRMRMTGRENIVLLEHVWAAELATVATLLALGEPVLPYLDVVSVALGAFLAVGRLGCVMAGCCHGEPSSIGIAYDEDAVRGGFPAELEGVRLFPVPLVESAGLAIITLGGLVALPWARVGSVTVWFLSSYAVLRIGTEGLRGDVRPHWLGLSVPRWMALVDLVVALALDGRLRGAVVDARLVATWVVLAATLALTIVLLARDDRRRLLRGPSIIATRRAARELAEEAGEAPRALTLPGGLTVALSRAAPDGWLHVSLAREGRADWPLLAEVAARAFPEATSDRCAAGERALHLQLESLAAEPPRGSSAAATRRALALLGAAARSAVSREWPTRAETVTLAAAPQPAAPAVAPTQVAASSPSAVAARIAAARVAASRIVAAPRLDYFGARGTTDDAANGAANATNGATNGAHREDPHVGP